MRSEELTYVPIVFMTILAVMALVDRTTPWSIASWNGPGPSPDFWKIAALLVLGWTLLVLGWRGAKTAFKCLIVIWHFALTAASVVYVLEAGDFTVRGEAIGFSLSVGLLAPAFSLTALVCALVWISGDTRQSARHGASHHSSGATSSPRATQSPGWPSPASHSLSVSTRSGRSRASQRPSPATRSCVP